EAAAVEVESDDGLQDRERRQVHRDVVAPGEEVRQLLGGLLAEQQGTGPKPPAREQLADHGACLRHEEAVGPAAALGLEVAARDPRGIPVFRALFDGHQFWPRMAAVTRDFLAKPSRAAVRLRLLEGRISCVVALSCPPPFCCSRPWLRSVPPASTSSATNGECLTSSYRRLSGARPHSCVRSASPRVTRPPRTAWCSSSSSAVPGRAGCRKSRSSARRSCRPTSPPAATGSRTTSTVPS